MDNSSSHRDWVLSVLDQYEVRLVRYAARILGDEHAARDAVQQTFLALCGTSTDKLGGNPASWLFTVCRNKVLDLVRKNGRCESFEDDDSQSVAGREPDPSVTVENEDFHRWLTVLIDDLPSTQREVLDLWIEGFSYREISGITERSEGSIRVIAHRALARLRDHPSVAECLLERTWVSE